jgi:muramoyltetrapeptide carboxypeptidase
MTKKISAKLPARLKPGDKIGVVAPAGPYDSEKFSRGVRIWEEMGYAVDVPESLLDARGYLAGADDHRADFVNRLFADKTIDAIVCARGGYGSLRILNLLDYDVIADNPKIFVGFSDITAILSVLFDRCGLVTFHGPVVTSLAESSEGARQSLSQAVSSDCTLEIKVSAGVTVSPGCGSGILCGGNLNTLCHLVGTPFAPGFDGKILFLEDRAEAPYKIDRMLTQMKLANCFQGVAGVVLGSFEDCGPADEILKIIHDTFIEYRVPILAGLAAGHGRDNLTLPMGLEATLDADRHQLTYQRVATTG